MTLHSKHHTGWMDQIRLDACNRILGSVIGLVGAALSMHLTSYERNNFESVVKQGLPEQLALLKSMVPLLMLIGAVIV